MSARPSHFLFLILLVLAWTCTPAPGQAQRAAPEAATRQPGSLDTAGHKSMVAAAHPLAARAARNMLRAGGSAIDAVIAAQMVLNLVEPQSSGIGGGGFLLYWDNEARQLASYDGREAAPAGAGEGLLLRPDGGPLDWPDAVGMPVSVGVPGLLAMLAAAHGAHGKLAWNTLFEPAILLARDGFGVSPRLSALLRQMGAEKFPPAARAYFFDAEGEARPLGHVLHNPALATTLAEIAAGGPDVFYRGRIGRDILAALAAAPGRASSMTAADLAGYRARSRRPVCVPYRASTVCGMGPPSSGGITIAQILGLLERFDLSGGPTGRNLHLIVEAQKLAYADRDRYLADADHVPVPAGLVDPGYLAARASRIDMARPVARAEPGMPPMTGPAPGTDGSREAPGTTQISVIDAKGNAASLTSSIETAFGSRIFVGGFLLNNQLTDFSFAPRDEAGRAIANRPGPGKRPRSSMAPTLVFDGSGNVQTILGSPGGSRIILYVAKAIIAMSDWAMSPQQAAALANFGSRNGPAEVEEGAAGDTLAAGLAARGHEVLRPVMTSGLHIIEIGPRGLAGGADPRREGVVLAD